MRKALLISLLALVLASCNKNEYEVSDGLKLINTFLLDIPDPSGLSRSHIDGFFYTISNETRRIYLVNNSSGIITQSQNVNSTDVEGVEYVVKTNSLYLLEEGNRRVVRTTQNGSLLGTFILEIPNNLENDGPEGIAFNPKADHFYVVNEKKPSSLYVYDLNFNPVSNHVLDFALDYSALDYDPVNEKLWILSDESSTLARCDLTGKPEKIYRTNVPKGEGLVVDVENNKVYIVSDSSSNLYVFSIEE